MNVSQITSTANPVVKEVCALKQKKDRDESGCFAIEGVKMLWEAVNSGVAVKYVFATQRVCEANADLLESADAEKIYVVNDAVMTKLSEWKTPQGLVAVVKKQEHDLDELLSRERLFALVLDGVSDPGNIGTIVRTSEAAGVDCIIATEGTADCFQPKALRASMGSVFRIPVLENSEKCGIIYKLKQNGVSIVSTSLQGQDALGSEVGADKLALVFGNEGAGISSEFEQAADTLLRLPMKGKVESLNVAVSAGILMYLINMKNFNS